MPEFRFDEETHTYYLGDMVLPSVTQVLKAEGFYNHRGDPWYMERGSIIHEVTELYDLDDLDMESVDPQIMPYLQAYIKFRKESGFRPGSIEFPLCHPVYLYAGTIDRLGTIGDEYILLDIKSGSPQKADALQLAAYHDLVMNDDECKRPAIRCYNLYLRSDGTYRFPEQKNIQGHLVTFLSALHCYRWKKENL